MRNLTKSSLNYKSLLTKGKYGLYLHEYQAYDILKKYQVPLVPVHHLSCRVLEPALLTMLMPLLKGSCPLYPRTNLSSMSLLRLRFMQEEEAKEHSNNQG